MSSVQRRIRRAWPEEREKQAKKKAHKRRGHKVRVAGCPLCKETT